MFFGSFEKTATKIEVIDGDRDRFCSSLDDGERDRLKLGALKNVLSTSSDGFRRVLTAFDGFRF